MSVLLRVNIAQYHAWHNCANAVPLRTDTSTRLSAIVWKIIHGIGCDTQCVSHNLPMLVLKSAEVVASTLSQWIRINIFMIIIIILFLGGYTSTAGILLLYKFLDLRFASALMQG